MIATRKLNHLSELLNHSDFSHIQSDPFYFQTDELFIKSPLELPQMEEGVEYLKEAMHSAGSIYIFGDRDVDGVASTAMVANFLQRYHVENGGGSLKVKVTDDGEEYGLCPKVLTEISSEKIDLLIILDIGSTNGPEIKLLIERLNCKVIVLDHHEPHPELSPELPGCAFINPMRNIAPGDSDRMATVGLVYKFLLTYSLSFTGDYNRIYLFGDSGRDGAWQAYRLGKYLGTFESRAELESNLQSLDSNAALEITEVNSDTILKLTPSDLKSISENPEQSGRLVLSRQIACRPKLKLFLQELSILVSVGSIADMMPLTGDTRSMVRQGIGFLSDGNYEINNIGYLALIKKLKLDYKQLRSKDLSWSLAPALNAAGRMGQTKKSLELLTARSADDARSLANDIVNLNQERRNRTKHNEELANKIISEDKEFLKRAVIFLYSSDFLPGVSGILATRMAELYNRPAICINPEGQYARGSARSQNGENVLELIAACSDQLVQFGGHVGAAGFSVEYERIDELEKAVAVAADSISSSKSHDAGEEQGESFHLSVTPAELSTRLMSEIDLFEPFGQGNPEIIFNISQAVLTDIKYLSDNKHLKFHVRGCGSQIEFVAWNMGSCFPDLKDDSVFNITGSLEWNFFRGRRSCQFRVNSLYQ